MGYLKNKKVLITGSTGAIGQEIAKKLASEGADIALHYFRQSGAALELSQELKSSFGIKTSLVSADIRCPRSVESMVGKILEDFGTIDILVNNAGISSDRYLSIMNEAVWDDVIDTNLTGPFNCIKYVLPTMVLNRLGRIINISSAAAICGMRTRTNYSTSKAGLIGLTKALAKEFGPSNILVNAIAPGMIEGGISEILPITQKKIHETMTPLKRFGLPQEVADAVYFLSSDLSSYINGEILSVTGGEVTWYL